MSEYIKSTVSLPKENTPVLVCINGRRPRKMYRLSKLFFYYNEELFRNGNYSGIGEGVVWRYIKQKKQKGE